MDALSMNILGIPAEALENGIEFLAGGSAAAWGAVKGYFTLANSSTRDANYRIAEILPENRRDGDREQLPAPAR